MMRTLLPPEVIVAESASGEPCIWEGDLLPEEAAALSTRTAPKRRREFTAGRNCARLALAGIGMSAQPIGLGIYGEPLWPVGVTGSITHCDGYAAAAVARCDAIGSLGIDAEVHARLPDGIDRMACTEAERRWTTSAPDRDRVHWPTVIFSAKESVYKAWFQLTRCWLGFEDAELTIDPAQDRFIVRLLVRAPDRLALRAQAFSGRFAVGQKLVLTAVVVWASEI